MGEPLELFFSRPMANYLAGIADNVPEGNEVGFYFHSNGTQEAVIERTHNMLTSEEAQKHADTCREAIR